MSAQPTHPGLVFLRARRDYDSNEALEAAFGAWAAAKFPTDLVPEPDLRAAERERDEARDQCAVLEQEKRMIGGWCETRDAEIADLRGQIDRQERLTRGPLGRLRALWGGR